VVPLSIDVKRRQQTQRDENEKADDERGYDVAHRESPVQ
jgi:hypothetical protein